MNAGNTGNETSHINSLYNNAEFRRSIKQKTVYATFLVLIFNMLEKFTNKVEQTQTAFSLNDLTTL